MSSLSSLQFNILQLWCMPGIGYKTIQILMPLLKQGWSIGRPVDERTSAFLSRQLAALQSQQGLVEAQRHTHLILDWVQQPDNHLIFFDDADYPLLLREIDQPPAMLMVKGQLSALCGLNISVVGSRNPSKEGLQNAQIFSEYLASRGFTLVSGGAAGIDRIAHESAMRSGASTIAVLGHGLNHCYPRSHFKLFNSIQQAGALISEFPLDIGPKPYFFPRRNRIITGLSHGVCVIEAGLESGSLVSARLAVEQGREVFAIPGSIHNPRAKGCHWLIQQGAKLVQSGEDILCELQYSMPDQFNNLNQLEFKRLKTDDQPQLPVLPDEASLAGMTLEQAIIAVLQVKPLQIEELAEVLSYAVLDDVVEAIVCLEMESRLKRQPENGLLIL